MPLPGIGILTSLFSSGKVIKSLPELIKLATGGNLKGKALSVLQDHVNEQSGRSGGKLLARGYTEQIDAVIEAKDSGLTLEQRLEVAKGLSINAALQTAEAAKLMLEYPQLQYAVVKAKEAGDSAAANSARAPRNAKAEEIKEGLVDVGRAVAGDLKGGGNA